MIRFQEVHKWFKTLHVLNDVNLHVRQGEVVVICGPSGSGKSTLIRTINKLEPIDKGKLVASGLYSPALFGFFILWESISIMMESSNPPDALLSVALKNSF
jgi:ABC-type transporter Mla maintaining outer membrane lipid asymmetry ATPase subunit MlaF